MPLGSWLRIKDPERVREIALIRGDFELRGLSVVEISKARGVPYAKVYAITSARLAPYIEPIVEEAA
jgi:hypothetical protein